jgi:hypothetical protein
MWFEYTLAEGQQRGMALLSGLDKIVAQLSPFIALYVGVCRDSFAFQPYLYTPLVE